MKKNALYGLFLLLLPLLLFTSCKDENDIASSPTITISEEDAVIDGANEGDLISIPFSIASDQGIRRITYYFIVNTANEDNNENPIILENFTENFPKTYDGSIDFPVRTEMNKLILIVFDKNYQASEVHVSLSDLKKLPVLRFDKDLDYKRAAFLGKNLRIRGKVTSEYDVTSLTYRVVNNGIAGSPVSLPITDKQDIDFNATILVESGLEKILFEVTNVHEGSLEKEFLILEIFEEDNITIEMEGGATEISNYMEAEENTIQGVVESGSDIVSLAYSVKKNGVFDTPVNVEIPEDVFDIFEFSFNIVGEFDTEAIKIIAGNESELSEEIIVDIPYVDSHIVYLTDVVLTTEIGAGKHNWFSCYLEPHVFDQQTAAQHSEMMDFVAATYTNGAPYLLSSMVYTAGGNYAISIAPYMVGFEKMTYLLMPASRADVGNEFSMIQKTSDMESVFDKYPYYATAGRYTSGAVRAGTYHGIAWGLGVSQNKALAIIKLNEVTTIDGISTIKFDIKFGKPDYRTMYNDASIMDYNP